MARRPLIGVCGPDRGGLAAWLMTRLALFRAGARAIRITPARGAILGELDGLVLGGGSDVAPGEYGQALLGPVAHARGGSRREHWLGLALTGARLLLGTTRGGVDKGRDELEMDLCRRALDTGLPVLGICRGAQLLNVVLGGSLHQDTARFYTEVPRLGGVLPRKRVVLEPGKVRGILKVDSCLVNSLHRQAVDALGRGVRVAARDAAGVVQAVECADLPFALGVQWHPEYMPQSRVQGRLFRALAEAAG